MTSLPPTADGSDAILVVVDRLSKMAHFIPTRSTATAKDIALLFFTNIFRLHGIPEEIISDRDSRFVSQFWSELFRILRTQLRLSTAHHQQTDGQSERTIRIFNQLIRCCASRYQTQWIKVLPALEFAYNSNTSSTTSYAPFYLANGYLPRTPVSLLNPIVSSDSSIQEFLQQTQATLQHASDTLHQDQEKQCLYADRKRRDVHFQTGDLVLLSTEHILPKNLPLTKRKLQPNFIGSFKILETIGNLNYRLDLPPSYRIHNVFHVSQIKAYIDPTSDDFRRPVLSPKPLFKHKGEDYYAVDRILSHRRYYKKDQYLVSWQGYDSSYNSWEPSENLSPDLINDFVREDTARSHTGV